MVSKNSPKIPLFVQKEISKKVKNNTCCPCYSTCPHICILNPEHSVCLSNLIHRIIIVKVRRDVTI